MFGTADVSIESIASVSLSASYFRSTSNNGHQQTGPVGPVRARNGREVNSYPLAEGEPRDDK
jgi:hypothetical protein